MPFTYDPLCPTNKDKVRLLCTDTDVAGGAVAQYFQDGEIDTFLTLMLNNVLRAAAVALLTIAAQETLLMKRITLLDLSTDGPAQAAALRDLAKIYQEKANLAEEAEEGGAFDWAEMVVDDFTARECLYKDSVRNA